MSHTTDEGDHGGLSPDAAFSVLGDETRLRILRTLGEATDLLSFSELRERLGRPDSGQFNYHLGKLEGHFVRKTDAGYELTRVGEDVISVVIAGTVNADPSIEPTVIDALCPLCDAPVEITYGDNQLNCSCTACDGIFPTDDASRTLFWFGLPPAGVEGRTAEEVFHATLTHTFHEIATSRAGVCPDCSGRITSTVDVCWAHDTDEEPRCPACSCPHMAEVTDVCQVCGKSARGPVRMAMLVHPTVTAFYHDHGIQHRFASWDAFRRSHNVREELVSEDPLELRLSIPAGDEELQLTVDADLEVLDATRVV